VGFSEARGDSIEVASIPIGEGEAVMAYIEKVGKPFLNSLLIFLFLMLVVRHVALMFVRAKTETGCGQGKRDQ
jgi:flagellar M-ring protein FliF